MSPPSRPFWATWDFTGGDWTPSLLKECALKAAALGYTGIQLNVEWAWMQPEGAEESDLSQADWAVKTVRSCGLRAALGLDHSAPPPWAEAEVYCVRDEAGQPIVHGDNRVPMLAQNSKQVREWVAGFLKVLIGHFGSEIGYVQGISTPLGETTWRCSSKKLFDHSRWAEEAYRSWLRAKYIDIRMLNEAWESQFKGWDDVPVGEGPRRSCMADFHQFRYHTLSSWSDYMRKSAKEAGGAWAFRLGGGHLHSDMQQLSFDMGRYARTCHLFLADGMLDPFYINMVRSAAEVAGVPWGIRLDRSILDPGLERDRVNAELVNWAKGVYALGGAVDIADFVHFEGMVREGGPADWGNPAAWPFQKEVRKLAESPEVQPRNNRRAVYVSAAEAQYWDGTDLEAGRERWLAMTDSGKKPQVDVVSDGLFTSSPDLLKRYTAGIEVPFAKVIARETRAALVQAMRLGVRMLVHNQKLAGSMDEHGKPQTPLLV